VTPVEECVGGDTLLSCNLRGVRLRERRSGLSRYKRRGWTRRSVGFSVLVQPVQPVQPRMKRENRRTLFAAEIINEVHARPQAVDCGFAPRCSDRLTWSDLSKRLNGTGEARESDRGSRQLDTRGRCATHRVLKSGGPRRSGRPRPHFSLLRQHLRA
jgi:hypothetical protein